MTADPKAERTLALSLVTKPEAYDYCLDLDPAMFTDTLASRIVFTVWDLLCEQAPVNAVSVQARMAVGKGGSVVPGWNKGNVVSAQECGPLAERIRELWIRREVEALAQRVGPMAIEQGSQAALREMAEALTRFASKPNTNAKSIGELTIDYIAELKQQADHPGEGVTFDTGYKLLDKHTGGLRVGELFVIAARPSQGKTSFVTGIAVHLAQTGIPVGCFWLEDDWRDAVRRYHQARHFLTSEDLRGSPNRALSRLSDVVMRSPDEMGRVLIDDTHGLTAEDISARMRRMHRENGVRVFFADHLGEMRITQGDRWGDRHDLALGAAARMFRDTAKELKAVPVLCSQMNRQIERRKDGIPVMADLDGSGQVEQAARVIAFISTPTNDKGESDGRFVVHLRKNMGGMKGEFDLKWIPERMAVVNP